MSYKKFSVPPLEHKVGWPVGVGGSFLFCILLASSFKRVCPHLKCGKSQKANKCELELSSLLCTQRLIKWCPLHRFEAEMSDLENVFVSGNDKSKSFANNVFSSFLFLSPFSSMKDFLGKNSLFYMHV